MSADPITFSLQLTTAAGTVTNTFAGWKAQAPAAVYRSLDEDELTFVVQGNVTTPCPFTYGDRVSLFRTTTPLPKVCIFVGTVTAISARGGVKVSDWRITCTNAWYQLKRTMFQQPLATFDGTCARLTVNTTKCVLYSDPVNGNAITTGQQIQNVVNYALSLGIPLALGTAPAFINVPFETVRDLTLADVIRRCLQWTPDAVSWCDYSSGLTIINFQQRAFLSPVTVDVAAAPRIVESFEIKERNDLIPAGVLFNYLAVKICPLTAADEPAGCPPPPPGSTQQVVTNTQDQAGAVTVPGALIGTIDVAQLTDSTNEPINIGLAGQYYASLLTPQWEGAITLRERECSGLVRPGQVLNLSNGLPAWATMIAVVQQVQEAFTTGESTVTLGPPTHLSPQEFANLIQLIRRRAFIQNAFAATRPPGDSGTPNCVAGIDPTAQQMLNNGKGNGAQMAKNINDGSSGSQGNAGKNLGTLDLDVCDAGVPSTKTVYAPAP